MNQRARARDARAWSKRRSKDDAVLFIVGERHVPHPFAPYMYAHWLDWCATHDAELRSRIELAHLPADLPANTAVLHAWVQDPVRERDEPLFGQLQDLEAQARSVGAAIIQPAEALSNSLRITQFERLSGAGLRTPRVVPVDAGFVQGLGGLSLPIIIRRNWGHMHEMLRFDSEAQLAEWLTAIGPDRSDWVAAEYIEVRSSDDNYRKYRYVMFGERGVNRHLIVSPNWEVRPKERVLTDSTIAEELEFVGSTNPHHRLLDLARRELEFDVAAFDYSIDSTGKMVVWEVNPYPDLSRPKGRPGEYLDESIQRSNEALAAFYRERLATTR